MVQSGEKSSLRCVEDMRQREVLIRRLRLRAGFLAIAGGLKSFSNTDQFVHHLEVENGRKCVVEMDLT